MRAALLVSALVVGCRTATPVIAERAVAPRRVEPKVEGSYFPLVDGAVYEYDATAGSKHGHERRFVRKANLTIGTVFYFIDEDDEQTEEPSIGPNAFGLGVYRLTDAGVETADAYFRSDLPKIKQSGVQLALAFPLKPGATTTLRGGKQLETTVVGTETVTVPAGTFECVRLDQREVWENVTHEGSIWLARGVGTVKRIYVTGRVEVLTAFHIP